jgi:antitoxin component YwqK of YwqJK toxin-antitoxin module
MEGEVNEVNEDGERIGPWEEFHSNGQLWFRGYYVDGLHHGPWEEFYEDGELCFRGSFHHGVRRGPCTMDY